MRTLALFLLLLLPACHSIPAVDGTRTDAPATLSIAAGDYERAYDAALDVLRDDGFAPALRDPRAGLIETEPMACPTLMEPWATHRAPSSLTTGNTINHRRRRVQFEFTPVDQARSAPPGEGHDPLGLAWEDTDLTQSQEPLDLTVRVWLEQAHHPGLRRNTWSRRATTQSEIYPAGGKGPLPRVIWSTVSRDPVAEDAIIRKLLAAMPETTP